MVFNIWHNWRGPSFSRHKPRWSLLMPILFLLAGGWFIQFYLSPILTRDTDLIANYFSIRHLIFTLIGLVALWVGYKLKLKLIFQASHWILLSGLILSLLAIIVGEGADARWLNFMGFSLQPVEIVKIGFILVGAGYLYQIKNADQQDFNTFFKANWLIWAILAVFGVIIAFFQGDFGSMVILGSIILAMMLVSDVKLKFFNWIVVAALLLASIMIVFTSYRLDRINVFLNPEADCLDKGYHICQSLIGIGSGGLTGRGFDESVQLYGYLPESHNDTIFAGVAEISGFAGSALLILAFIALLFLVYQTAFRSEDSLMLVSIGFLTWIGLQAIINIAGVLNIIPLKGITLPFVSYGGTSLVAILFMTGIILQISAYTVYKNETRNHHTSAGGRGHRRTRYSASSPRPRS